MKLSEKGRQDVLNICWESSHNYRKIAEELGFFDFKQEHFKSAVVLTVEEAKLIQKLLRHCYFATDIQEVEELVLVQDGFLKERIEQAEMSKQSTNEG